MSDDRERIDAFLRWEWDSTSARIEPSVSGTAVYNDEFPSYWDGNLLLVERPAHVTPELLMAETDRLYDGFAHRSIVILDASAGARFAPAFVEEGWEINRLVFMVNRRDADRSSALDVEECSFEELYPAMVEANLGSHGGMTRDAAESNAAVRRVFVDIAGVRFFAARIDSQVAGFCELLVHDGVGELDNVHTLERFRGRGFARAVVGRSVREAGMARADLLFLIADDADWPKDLYRKLGFDPVGRFWQFTKPPVGESYR